jgi:hypothetical protein
MKITAAKNKVVRKQVDKQRYLAHQELKKIPGEYK